MASKVTGCFIFTRDDDDTLFSFSDEGTTVNLDGYLICPREFSSPEQITKLADELAKRKRLERQRRSMPLHFWEQP